MTSLVDAWGSEAERGTVSVGQGVAEARRMQIPEHEFAEAPRLSREPLEQDVAFSRVFDRDFQDPSLAGGVGGVGGLGGLGGLGGVGENASQFLTHIHHMIGDTERVVLQKITELQSQTLDKRTQQSIRALAQAHEQPAVPSPPPKSKSISVFLVVVIVLSCVLFLGQGYYYFRRVMTTLRMLHLQRVDFDVIHPKLIDL